MKKELRRAFTSPSFLLSALIFFVTLQGYAVPAYFSTLSEPAKYRESALALSLGGIFFGGAILLQPFCSPMAHAVSQVDDLNSGFMPWCVLRGSIKQYIFIKSISSFLAAAIAIGGAFLFHAIIWYLVALPYNPNVYPEHEIGFFNESLFFAWAKIANGLPIYAEVSLGLAFTAGVWSIVALAVSVWVPDRLLAITIPACIYELWSSSLTYYLFGFRLISPSTLFNDGQTPDRIRDALIAYGVILLVSLLTYYAGVRRRSCYA
jgi:hypothetical protein